MKRYSIILTLAVIILSVILWQQASNTRLLSRELNILNNQISSLQFERDSLIAVNNSLDTVLLNVQKSNDSIQSELDKSIKRVKSLQIENRKLRDSLLNAPPDTIYLRMQEVIPTTEPLIYPFSAPQIRFYYEAYIDNGFNLSLVKSQEIALNSCIALTTGLRGEVSVVTRQNENLSRQVVLADMQRDLYKISYEKYYSRYTNSKKIHYLWGGAGFVLGILLK